MSLQATIKRYTIIIEKLQRKTFPSAQVILHTLHEEGLKVSERSLVRDITAIRNEFGIDIQYDKARNGYFVNHENTINFESFVRFLEIVNTGDLLMQNLKESKEALKYISFDAEGSLKGVEHLKQLLIAVRDKNRIAFRHFNFQTRKTKRYALEPHLLKQYGNRWYVIGKLKGQNEWRTFGIDRIEELEVLKEKFAEDKQKNIQELLGHVVGLNFSGGKRETVKIAVKYPQASYIKTLPLHPSQEIESETENEVVFSLFVIPNLELIQKILFHVEYATVLEPKWLRGEVKNHLTKTIKNYD